MEAHVPSLVLGVFVGLCLAWLLRVLFRAATARLSADMARFNAERDQAEEEYAVAAELERIEQTRAAEAERVRRQHEALQGIF